MFGTLRFFLALLVIHSHFSDRLVATIINVGICAVIGFFILSGVVMTHIILFNYAGLGKTTLYFYLDRALRIFPQFLLWVCLSQISVLLFHFEASPYLASGGGIHKFLMHILLVPLNYSMFIPAIKTYLLLPQAWSLALEEQFYWIFPFLVLYRWTGPVVALMSLVVFGFGANGYINSDYFTFRLLPAVMYIFLMGKYLTEFNLGRKWPSLAFALILYLGIVCITFWPAQNIINNAQYKYATGLGVIVFFPIIAILSQFPRRKWDDWLGNASYGMFLSHNLIIDYFRKFHWFVGDYKADLAMVVAASVAAGFAGFYLVEKLITPLRYKIRARHRQAIKVV
jgi:peptidoglycan/LPS O-acetylase OafA/YrhL